MRNLTTQNLVISSQAFLSSFSSETEADINRFAYVEILNRVLTYRITLNIISTRGMRDAIRQWTNAIFSMNLTCFFLRIALGCILETAPPPKKNFSMSPMKIPKEMLKPEIQNFNLSFRGFVGFEQTNVSKIN